MSTIRLSILVIIVGVLNIVDSKAQGVIISDNSSASPNASAILDLDVSTMSNKKGLLVPRMTSTEMNNISSPSESLLIYQTNGTSGFKYDDGANWVGFGSSSSGGNDDLGDHVATQNITMSGNWLSGDGSNSGIKVTDAGKVGVGVNNPEVDVHLEGEVRLNDLSGSGTRMVVADADGNLSTQTIALSVPTSRSASSNKSISSASYSGGNSVLINISLSNMPASAYLVHYSLVFSGSSDGSFIINAGGTNIAASERSESTGNVSGMAVVTLASTGDF